MITLHGSVRDANCTSVHNKVLKVLPTWLSKLIEWFSAIVTDIVPVQWEVWEQNTDSVAYSDKPTQILGLILLPRSVSWSFRRLDSCLRMHNIWHYGGRTIGNILEGFKCQLVITLWIEAPLQETRLDSVRCYKQPVDELPRVIAWIDIWQASLTAWAVSEWV